MKRYIFPDSSSTPETIVLADGAYPIGEVAVSMLRSCARVVCCDGAADNFTTHGGIPVAIVGDCDSLSAENRAHFASILHPSSEQETNDQTKAVNYCLEQGWHDIVILGATGKREDHTIGNISLLAEYMADARITMVTDYGVFTAIAEDSLFESFPGQQVSIFSLAPHTKVEVSGLIYTPGGNRLTSWWQGTLNESSSDSFQITTDGILIIYRAFR